MNYFVFVIMFCLKPNQTLLEMNPNRTKPKYNLVPFGYFYFVSE